MEQCVITEIAVILLLAAAAGLHTAVHPIRHHTQQDLCNRRDRCAQPNMEQRGALHPAQQKNSGDSHTERAHHALHHDKQGLSAAVEIAHKTEKDGGEQTVDAVGFQIFVGVCDHLLLVGKDAGKRRTAEKRKRAHHCAGNQRGFDSVEQCFAGAFEFSRSVVLRHKGGDRLHVRRRHQHQEYTDLFSHAHGGRFHDAHAVDQHLNEQE